MRSPAIFDLDIPRLLGNIAYFQGMTQEALSRLGKHSHIVKLRKDELLLDHGAPSVRNVYAVLDGQIHLGLPVTHSIRSIRFIDPGMTMGESVLLMQAHPPYRAIATRKTTVLVINGERWMHEIQSVPTMTLEVLRHMAKRRLEVMHSLVASSQRTDLSRVSGYILEFRPKHQSECFSFQLPARKLDIAANLGMSNASFSRALQRLKKMELIHVNASFIEVLKASQLEQIIQPRHD
jgi:CRP-like cAMP-binding protein